MSSRANKTCIHWFRHGLRLTDMPSLSQAIKDCQKIYPIFIFDGLSAGLNTAGFNRTRYLLECLKDLDDQLASFGGRLYSFRGDPVEILRKLFRKWSVTHLSFEQDPEPIWHERDNNVKALAASMNVQVIERISHTLWDPAQVIEFNGGQPPLNYEMFCHTVNAMGPPERPLPKPDFKANKTIFPLDDYDEDDNSVPNSPEFLGILMEHEGQANQIWFGGETRALAALKSRLELERTAFENGDYLPTQSQPDIMGPARSLSPALRHGCLSVRKFYWDVNDIYESIAGESIKPRIVGQLIWREFFYTMSVNNSNYGQMKDNSVCLQISWKDDPKALKAWSVGQTGYPFIDAAMRQLLTEGWIHHTARNAVACFLTRGDLWLSWEHGVQLFLKYLIDADWSVCAGNWMWISSSAFDTILQSDACISPIMYGRWLEPTGNYIRKYVKELVNMPTRYIFNPAAAPIDVQRKANCIIGVDYPEPMVNHDFAFKVNRQEMETLKSSLLGSRIHSDYFNVPSHVAPSHLEETKAFLCLPEDFFNNLVI